MFRHQGKTRTPRHNLRIASLLSFVAGMVNVAGFLAVGQLTTNVTGHFAFFVDEVFKMNIQAGLVYFLYIFFFFLGSFVSNFLIETTSRKDLSFVYVLPASIEVFILFVVGIWGDGWVDANSRVIAFSLLFAMGLQNSLVTTISNSSVRTTHLTGLFTDLGIELSQLFFYKSPEQKQKLLTSIQLRFTIISFFFLGGVVGGISFSDFGLRALCFTAVLLILGMIYDFLKFRVLTLRRKFKWF